MSLQQLKRHFLINLPLLKFFFVYCILSELLFVITSDGWTGLFYFILGSGFYFGFLLLLLVISFFRSFYFNLRVWQITICLQLFILVFNFGDCGDAYGGSSFIQRFIKGQTGGSCHNINVFEPLVSDSVILILILVYIILLFIIVFSSGIQMKSGKLRNKSIFQKIKYFWSFGQ